MQVLCRSHEKVVLARTLRRRTAHLKDTAQARAYCYREFYETDSIFVAGDQLSRRIRENFAGK